MAAEREGSGINVVDVLDRVLDKGIVIDAAVRVAIVGVELIGVDARVVVASIETYLRHADALAYTDMVAYPQPRREPPLFAEPAGPAATPGDSATILPTAVPLETPPAVPLETPPAVPAETRPAVPLDAPPAVPLDTPPAVSDGTESTPGTATDPPEDDLSTRPPDTGL